MAGRLTEVAARRMDPRYWHSRPEGHDRLRSHLPGFRFVDLWLAGDRQHDPCAAGNAEEWGNADLPATDREGRARGQLRMPLIQCEFAEVDLSARSAEPQSRSWSSAPVRRLLARHSRYLGLSGLDRPRVALGTRLSFAAVAVEIADLSTRSGVPIRLAVQAVDSGAQAFRCQLRSGRRSACRWRPKHPGSYQIMLRAEGYPPARFSVRVGPGAEDPPGREPARLWVADDDPLRPSELVLKQPYETGRVLLVLNDQRLRGAQWFDLQGGVQRLPVDLPKGFSGCLHALALVIPASPPGTAVEAIDHARTQLCLDPPSAELVALQIQPIPGETRRIRLRVRSRQPAPVTVNLTVFEDLSATQGPTRLANGELTHCFHFPQLNNAPLPTLHTLQGAEVWRNRAGDAGRAEATPSVVVDTGASELCVLQPRRLIPPTHPLDLAIPTQQRNLLWQPDLLLAPGEVREFEVDLPVDHADWLVELLAVDESLRVQTESHQIPRSLARTQVDQP